MIIGLLSWYDERPDWLYELAYSLRVAGVTHLCALDGAYARLPNGQPHSDPAQHKAIDEGAKAAGIGVTIRKPKIVWSNEMAKRTELFDLGRAVLTDYGRTPSYDAHDDWFMITDADEFVYRAPSDLQGVLRGAAFGDDQYAADVRVYTPNYMTGDFHPDSWVMYRKLFRALPDLEVTGRHYTYSCTLGKLWGPGRLGLLPAKEIHDLQIVHRQRPEDARRVAQRQYYRDRDLAQDEFDPCDSTGCNAPAARIFPDGQLCCRKHAHLYEQTTGQKPTAYS